MKGLEPSLPPPPDDELVHDEPARTVLEHELREIRRSLRWQARLSAEAGEREAERLVLLREQTRSGVVRIVVERGSVVAERLSEPAALTAVGVIVRWTGVTVIGVLGILYGVEMTGLGLTIRSVVEHTLHDTGGEPK